MKLSGIYAAIATPFDYQGGLYKAKVQHNVEKWNKTQLAGYAVGTRWGEGQLLRFEERVQLWAMVREWCAEGRALIADVTAEGVAETLALAGEAAGLGYNAVLCSMPLRYPETAELYANAVADGSPVPVIVHGERIDHPNVAAVLVDSIARQGELTARAEAVWESLQGGAAGAILGSASADPYSAILVWEAFRTREVEAGLDCQARVRDWASVPELKGAMDRNGYYGGPPRLPLSAVRAAGVKAAPTEELSAR